MTVWADSNIAWVDVETDGLDASQNHLLEVACLVTDKDLNILDRLGFQSVVFYTEDATAEMRKRTVPFVREMHDKTGLWERLHSEGKDLWQIDQKFSKYLSRFGEPGRMPVGGNSVRLDMNFIDEFLPTTSGFLDYHMRDVSTIAGFAESWYGEPNFTKHNDHTAMTDIRESIREMRHYRETVFRPVSETIELTPEMVVWLESARRHEKARVRYLKNESPGRAAYSRDERTRSLRNAITLGVPEGQARRYVERV